jgi:hypothetical protein
MSQVVTKFKDISVGDVVNLKSGSSDLTVVGFSMADSFGPIPPNTAGATFVEESIVAVCYGFTSTGVPISAKFPVEVLNVKTPVAPPVKPAA